MEKKNGKRGCRLWHQKNFFQKDTRPYDCKADALCCWCQLQFDLLTWECDMVQHCYWKKIGIPQPQKKCNIFIYWVSHRVIRKTIKKNVLLNACLTERENNRWKIWKKSMSYKKRREKRKTVSKFKHWNSFVYPTCSARWKKITYKKSYIMINKK